MNSMKSLLFIKKRSFTNSLIRRLKKPTTYLWLIPMIAMIGFYIFSFAITFKEFNLESPQGFYAIALVMSVFSISTNILVYSKKKGLVFTKADVNFCFSAPVNPKLLLIYAAYRNFVGNVILAIIGLFMGIFFCHVPVGNMLLFVLVAIVFETAFEVSLIIILYGSEKVNDKVSKVIRIAMISIFVIIAGMIICKIIETGKIASAVDVLNSDAIMAVPLIGWIMAVLRFVILGPTLLNTIFTCVFLLVGGICIVIAWKISCNGEYYEVAHQFADDYEEALQKSKEGKIAVVGKKEKYKDATVKYNGKYAKAIYYRQLLECKKQKFGKYGLGIYLYLLISVCLVLLTILADMPSSVFIIPGITAYITFLFSEVKSKLEKEVKNPYTFLIPDTAFNKLVYSTKLDFEKCAMEGLLLTVPAGIVMGLNVFEMILIILLHVIIRCVKMYISVCVEAFIGERIIAFVKSILQLMIFGIVFVVGILIAVAFVMLKLEILALLGMVIYGAGMLALFMLLASKIFVRMEVAK